LDLDARPYVKNPNEVARLPKTLKDVDPTASGEVYHHMLSAASPESNESNRIKCDVCRNDIKGPLFSCIHCLDGLQCCIDCSESYCIPQLHDPNSHAFQIYFEDIAQSLFGGGGGGGGGEVQLRLENRSYNSRRQENSAAAEDVDEIPAELLHEFLEEGIPPVDESDYFASQTNNPPYYNNNNNNWDSHDDGELSAELLQELIDDGGIG
jgi:hypothetical protein